MTILIIISSSIIHTPRPKRSEHQNKKVNQASLDKTPNFPQKGPSKQNFGTTRHQDLRKFGQRKAHQEIKTKNRPQRTQVSDCHRHILECSEAYTRCPRSMYWLTPWHILDGPGPKLALVLFATLPLKNLRDQDLSPNHHYTASHLLKPYLAR